MNRLAALPYLAVGAALIAVALAGVAVSLDDPVPPARVVLTPTREVAAVRTREPVAVVTDVPTRTPSPRPTVTPLPNCEITLFQNMTCAWPTATQVLPIPTCGPRVEGLTCVRKGVVQATIPLPTTTPTYALGVVIREERES